MVGMVGIPLRCVSGTVVVGIVGVVRGVGAVGCEGDREGDVFLILLQVQDGFFHYSKRGGCGGDALDFGLPFLQPARVLVDEGLKCGPALDGSRVGVVEARFAGEEGEQAVEVAGDQQGEVVHPSEWSEWSK